MSWQIFAKKRWPSLDELLVRTETPILLLRQKAGEIWNRNDRRLHFYLDTNLFASLCQSDQIYQQWQESLKLKNLLTEKSIPCISITPFLFLEYIGVAIPQPDQTNSEIPRELVRARNASKIAEHIFKTSRKFFSVQTVLQPQHLKMKACKKKMHLKGPGKKIFEDSIESILRDSGFEDPIYDYLSWDHVLKFQYKNEIKKRMHLAFASWYFGWTRKDYEFPAGRFLKANWDLLYQAELRKSKKEKRSIDAEMTEMNRSLDLGTSSDYVDTELLHLLLVGKFVNGVRRPVQVFTCDLEHKVRHRIAAFNLLLKFHSTKVQEETWQGNPLPVQMLRPGVVYFCDSNSGRIISHMNVAEAL